MGGTAKRTRLAGAAAVVALLAGACSGGGATGDLATDSVESPAQEWAVEVEEEAFDEALPGLNPPNGEPYPDPYFRNPGVNPFIDTRDDVLSTFAVDVDTASYTVARRWVVDGNLPHRDSVRVEEFVNYFDQRYAPPVEGAFAIHSDGAPTPFVQNDRYQLMRIGLQSAAPFAGERKDAALTFVIDVSGSMDMENRLGLVRQSLRLLIDELGARDTVAIVVYGSTARLVLPPTSIAERETVIAAVESLRPEGSTNAEAGLHMGYELAYEAFRPGGINRVILASDGVANTGVTGADGILSQIREHADAGIQMVSLGFGMGNFNDVLLEQLANDGDGFYAYIDDLREAERLFVNDLTATLQTVALDAKAQVEFNGETVESYRLVGFENRAVDDERFRDDTVDAGQIGAGHSSTALYEVALRPEAVDDRLATVRLRWTDPDTRESVEIAHDVRRGDFASSFDAAAPQLQLSAVVAAYAEVLRESPWALGYGLSDVAARAAALPPGLLEDPRAREFIELVGAAARLSG
ncbi:MAG TPA: von Willebrand factor type A domain-containing protein [Egibacteraceae bacterium]|nr:von Willebrand factor type A domain-containing protein [Egibacteraceae bacterium]